jgi:hypothetical protein
MRKFLKSLLMELAVMFDAALLVVCALPLAMLACALIDWVRHV